MAFNILAFGIVSGNLLRLNVIVKEDNNQNICLQSRNLRYLQESLKFDCPKSFYDFLEELDKSSTL